MVQRWQYWVVALPSNQFNRTEDMTSTLQELGNDGWELVSVVARVSGGGGHGLGGIDSVYTNFFAFLKRPID
jgi:hypothetical protein